MAYDVIEYAPITVSSARELTSVSMCYSQGGGFSTSLSRSLQLYCAHSESIVLQTVCLLCVVMFGGTVMPYLGRR